MTDGVIADNKIMKKEIRLIIVMLITSWILCIATVAAIFWCFGWFDDYSIKIATGIWLTLGLIRGLKTDAFREDY